jgi:hypothetical protein
LFVHVSALLLFRLDVRVTARLRTPFVHRSNVLTPAGAEHVLPGNCA